MKHYSSIISFYSLLTCVTCYAQLPEFTKLQHIGDLRLLTSQKSIFWLGVSGKKVLEEFTQHYKVASTKVKALHREKIPKILHQIWLGSPLPDKYKKWQHILQVMHPDWEYKLWTDKDIEQLKLVNTAHYKASRNYGERSDIARYEILYKYGGVYIDIDIEFVRPLTYLHERYDFYAAFEPLWSHTYTCLSIGNALIASVPGHPVLAECIQQITQSVLPVKTLNEQLRIVAQTGPILFTRACYKHRATIKKSGIILPSELFYPLDSKKVTFEPSRFCLHHWTHSWLQ